MCVCGGSTFRGEPSFVGVGNLWSGNNEKIGREGNRKGEVEWREGGRRRRGREREREKEGEKEEERGEGGGGGRGERGE